MCISVCVVSGHISYFEKKKFQPTFGVPQLPLCKKQSNINIRPFFFSGTSFCYHANLIYYCRHVRNLTVLLMCRNIWSKQYFILSKLHIIYKHGILLNGLDSKLQKLICILSTYISRWHNIYEPRYEKTGFLHKRKQRRRSASRLHREADQRLCFRYTDCTIPLLPKSEILSL